MCVLCFGLCGRRRECVVRVSRTCIWPTRMHIHVHTDILHMQYVKSCQPTNSSTATSPRRAAAIAGRRGSLGIHSPNTHQNVLSHTHNLHTTPFLFKVIVFGQSHTLLWYVCACVDCLGVAHSVPLCFVMS